MAKVAVTASMRGGGDHCNCAQLGKWARGPDKRVPPKERPLVSVSVDFRSKHHALMELTREGPPCDGPLPLSLPLPPPLPQASVPPCLAS